MRVTYLRLENVAGLVIGCNKDKIEIDFSRSKNKIIAIQAPNASGKSVLLSSISPFSGVTSIDDRSSLSYIVPGKNGYKEIHYVDGEDEYVIKHYYKASKDTHNIKSYFMLNGEELNENGNVRSFLSLVEMHFGLTQDMMRLIRLGSNVSSLINLTPAARKEYIGKLIEEIDIYLKIYKGINEDIKVTKALIAHNNKSMYECHISDDTVEEERLTGLTKTINKLEKEKQKLVIELAKLKELISNNDIDDLHRKRSEAEASINEFKNNERIIKENNLEGVTVEKLISDRKDKADEKIAVMAKIDSYRLSIDNTYKAVERLEGSIKRITSDSDIQSLTLAITDLRDQVNSAPKVVKTFKPPENINSEILNELLGKLRSFNMIANTIFSFGNRPIEVYLGLKEKGKSVDSWLKDQAKKSMSRIKDSDLKDLMDTAFQSEGIIYPNCDTEYQGCPYYRFAETIQNIREKMEEESFDPETLRYIQIISNNVDNMMNEIDHYERLILPDVLRELLTEKSILKRLRNKLVFFDLSEFQEYVTIVKEHEVYVDNYNRLQQYENQLAAYKRSGLDAQMDQIKEMKDSIEFYKTNISTLTSEANKLDKDLGEIDRMIAVVTRYNDGKKYQKMFEANLEAINQKLSPLESAADQKRELEFQITQIDNVINLNRNEHKSLEAKLIEYRRLVKEGAELDVKFKELNIILKASATKEGIPVIYINRYLKKIRHLANSLLELIYHGDFKLAKFEVDDDTFEIPYIKNGTKISDLKYASQSENAIGTMAISFALTNRATGKYNIPLLDEVDGGLDDTNRSAFLTMLYAQMNEIHAEQVFMISQNLSQMANIPMDCIRLADVGTVSKLQNVIYE